MKWQERMYLWKYSAGISSKIHRYFNDIFHELNILKKVITTETFNVNFHYKFIKFWIILFFQLWFMEIYILGLSGFIPKSYSLKFTYFETIKIARYNLFVWHLLDWTSCLKSSWIIILAQQLL